MTPDELRHLLRRTEYTASPARVAELSGRPRPDVVDDILDFSRNPSDSESPPPTALPSGRVSISRNNLVWWWLHRMATVPRPLAEKLTFFWHGHFTSELEKVGEPEYMLSQNRLYRSMATGDVRLLTQAMSIEPAMLRYLDNNRNLKSSPNQNFARELLELFLLGIGNYSETDVEGVSRAWTGHTVDPNSRSYVFRPVLHDAGSKTIFGSTRNWDGPDVVNEILRDNPSLRLLSARLVTRKLWEFLAHPGPDPTLVNTLAEEFVDSGLDIRTLVRAVLMRDEFYGLTAVQGLVRSPVDVVVAGARVSGIAVNQFALVTLLEGMGQVPFDPPNVSGWRSNSSWINTSAWGSRMSCLGLLAQQMRMSGRFSVFAMLTPEQAADRAADLVGIGPLSLPTRAALIDLIRAERRIAVAGGVTEVQSLLAAVLNSPEFHIA